MSCLFTWHKNLDPKTSEGLCGELRWVRCDSANGYKSTGEEAFGNIPSGSCWVDGGFCEKPAYGFAVNKAGYHDGVLKCPEHGGPKEKMPPC